ncbi:hypothetical protein ACVC7V_17620 [Hydrogenophaga sp. A37]|uniref:hypothetical protein n=1 Tax=Hydrogenophaga sp. A37 TaxID=1945864 RepID=UPI00117ACF33|nr:hypothetical protein [Hydrogenophaga sp. A37]
MNKLLIATLALILSGCATFKVEQTEVVDTKITLADSSAPIKVALNGSRFGGSHCYEPMIFVLTLGIIPTHCVSNYSVTMAPAEPEQGQAVQLGTFRITTMSGWIALFLAPLPHWNFGSPESPEVEIKRVITKK